jgi:dTDP-4-dehydrorhamnose 3,5-epimerase
MQFLPTKISDVVLVRPDVFGDERGFFMETWQQQKFADAGIGCDFVQDNQSRSQQGVLRGLHYQLPPYAQGKLVRVVIGEVFDVAVDIRQGSLTFGQWVGVVLSEKNKQQLWIPPGFAHGFITCSQAAEVLYKATAFYAPECERCILWNDPDIGIDWPYNGSAQLSDKDRHGSYLAEAELPEL